MTFISAQPAFGGFGTTTSLGGFGAPSAAPQFSFNTPSFGAQAPSTSAFGGFASSKFSSSGRNIVSLISNAIFRNPFSSIR